MADDDDESLFVFDIPNHSSKWKKLDAENVLGLKFQLIKDDTDRVAGGQAGYQSILRRVCGVKEGEKSVIGTWWDGVEFVVKVYQDMLADLLTLEVSPADSLKLARILTEEKIRQDPNAMTAEDVAHVKELLGKVDAIMETLVNGLPVVVLANYSARFSCIANVIGFLNCLKEILIKCLRGAMPNECSFQQLFLEFARVFFIPFRPWESSGNTVAMRIYGTQVSGSPDLQFDKIGGDKHVVVVTVGEVKRRYHACRKEWSSESETEMTESDCARKPAMTDFPTVDDDMDELPDYLCGQHAIELLLELPHSCLSVENMAKNKDCVLGLVVQGTKVRLTCLNLRSDLLRYIQNSETPQDAKKRNVFDNPHLYYTRTYDMLSKSDRSHLVYIMVTVASLAEDRAKTALLLQGHKRTPQSIY